MGGISRPFPLMRFSCRERRRGFCAPGFSFTEWEASSGGSLTCFSLPEVFRRRRFRLSFSSTVAPRRRGVVFLQRRAGGFSPGALGRGVHAGGGKKMQQRNSTRGNFPEQFPEPFRVQWFDQVAEFVSDNLLNEYRLLGGEQPMEAEFP